MAGSLCSAGTGGRYREHDAVVSRAIDPLVRRTGFDPKRRFNLARREEAGFMIKSGMTEQGAGAIDVERPNET
ncbi:hypothetical protein [Sphingomonas sp. 8AM]|uniref:hypothetical protein n=1 Tax=Sphingomonas sp. 8AM TaxID=2653170 RepID=UPI0013591716|nr:hypothetical protein [Sphingomonas sp. 8AM]